MYKLNIFFCTLNCLNADCINNRKQTSSYKVAIAIKSCLKLKEIKDTSICMSPYIQTKQMSLDPHIVI